MADPLTGLATVGAVSALLQVIDFSAKVISETKKLLNSSDDAMRENIIVERLTLEHSNLVNRLVTYNNNKRPLDAEEQAVDNLAQECKRESAKLLRQLDELKIEKRLTSAKRVWRTARTTTKALQKRKAIEQQQKYLAELHNQLSTELLQVLRTTQLSGFQDLIDRLDDAESKNAAIVLQAKQTILQALEAYAQQHAVSIGQRFSETYSKIDNRLNQQEKHEKAKLIVDSLRFPEMRLRRTAIPEAYQDTFSWIFKDTSSSFRAWLSSSEDIFWICGKAGSGKSTLMKYLSGHPRIKKYLQLWAGENQLVVVDSYLWNSGTALQRNEQGMLQELLYQTLSRNLDLVKVASPIRWQSDLIFLRRPDPWSRDELVEALHHVMEHTGNTTHFCFFVDGLDEYHGEHSRLITTLRSFAKHSRIKLCVSSRPWNVFRNAFKDLRSTFRLEDLTYNDICLYVVGELEPLVQREPVAQTLVTSIVEKAQGVFLWVFLVLRSLREGIEEGDSPSLLGQRVDEFPSDLEDYFRLILGRVSKTYRKQTSQALKLASLCLSENGPRPISGNLSVLTFWFLRQGILDSPRFAFDLDFRYFPTDEEPHSMYEDTRRYLSACCKDFLCIAHIQIPSETSFSFRFEFLHRTVFDFLENEDMRQVIDEGVPLHFKHPRFPSWLALARLKLIPNIKRLCRDSTYIMKDALQGIQYDDQALELVIECEKIAVHYLDSCCPKVCDFHQPRYGYSDNVRTIVGYFTAYQLHSFVEKLILRNPYCLQDMELETWSFLEPALGMSSSHLYAISEIDVSFLSLLLQHRADPNHRKGPVWHEFLIKEATEASSWSEADEEHAAKVTKLLISFGADMQSKVVLPPGFKLAGLDKLNDDYLPWEILTALFSEQQMEAIHDAIQTAAGRPCNLQTKTFVARRDAGRQ